MDAGQIGAVVIGAFGAIGLFVFLRRRFKERYADAEADDDE
jgi:hypothetical protein